MKGIGGSEEIIAYSEETIVRVLPYSAAKNNSTGAQEQDKANRVATRTLKRNDAKIWLKISSNSVDAKSSLLYYERSTSIVLVLYQIAEPA
jgi:hypothetical protein